MCCRKRSLSRTRANALQQHMREASTAGQDIRSEAPIVAVFMFLTVPGGVRLPSHLLA